MNVLSFLMFNFNELLLDSPKAYLNKNNLVIISILLFSLLFFINLFIRFNSKKEKEAYNNITNSGNHLFKTVLFGDFIYYLISLIFGLIISVSILIIDKYVFNSLVSLRFMKIILYLFVHLASIPLLSMIPIYYKEASILIQKYNYLPYVISLVSLFSFAFISKGTAFVILFITSSILVSPYIILKFYQLLSKLRSKSSSANLFSNFFIRRRMAVLYVVAFIVLFLGVKSYGGQVNTYKVSNQFFRYEYAINRLYTSKYEELKNEEAIKLMPISEEHKVYILDDTIYIYETDFSLLSDFTNISIVDGNLNSSSSDVIAINEEYAIKHSLKVGDKVDVKNDDDVYNLTISAIFRSTPTYISFVPLNTFGEKNVYFKILVNTNYLSDQTREIGRNYDVRIVSKQLDYNNFFSGPSSYLIVSTIALIIMIGVFVTLNVFMNYTVKESEMENLKIFKSLPVYQNSLSRIIYLNKLSYFISCLLFFIIYFLLSYSSQLNLFKESKISILSTMTYTDFFSFVLEIFIFYNIIFLMEYIISNPFQGVDDERKG